MPEKQPHEIAFEQARARLRVTGAGGVSESKGTNSQNIIVPQNPGKNLTMGRDGIIYVGGRNVKTTTRKDSGSIRILDLGRKKSI